MLVNFTDESWKILVLCLYILKESFILLVATLSQRLFYTINFKITLIHKKQFHFRLVRTGPAPHLSFLKNLSFSVFQDIFQNPPWNTCVLYYILSVAIYPQIYLFIYIQFERIFRSFVLLVAVFVSIAHSYK